MANKTHLQLAQEIEALEKNIREIEDIETNKPDITINVVAKEPIVIKENHEQWCLAMKAFFATLIDKRKDEVRNLLDGPIPMTNEELLSKKKKTEGQ